MREKGSFQKHGMASGVTRKQERLSDSLAARHNPVHQPRLPDSGARLHVHDDGVVQVDEIAGRVGAKPPLPRRPV